MEQSDLLNRWKWKEGTLRRRRPLRLVDREGLQALIKAVQGASEQFPGTSLNGVQTAATSIDSLVATMPRRVTAVYLYGERGAVELTSKRAGKTVIWRSSSDPVGLSMLVSTLENHGRPLSPWSRFLWWLPLSREQTVLSTRRRDEVDDRRENRRNAWISAVLGLVGGIIGGVATLYAASRWGTP